MNTNDNNQSEYLNVRQAAAYLGRLPRTLQTWRSTGSGPRYYKRNQRILYKSSDIDSWIESTARTSTQEVTQ